MEVAPGEGILDLETRPRVRVFARVDRFDRFVSLIIYVPRDRYNTGVRERIGALLAQAYQGRVTAFYPYFPEGPLVRVQFIIGRQRGPTPDVDPAWLEAEIAGIIRTWQDRLGQAIAGLGARGEALLAKYGAAGLISCGPWLLSVFSMLLIGSLGRGLVDDSRAVERFQVCITWAFAGSLIPSQVPRSIPPTPDDLVNRL